MNYENFKTLSVSTDKGVAFVTLSHGEINLLDMDMLIDLDRLGRELEQDDEIKVMVLQSANPDFFVAHADLGTIATLPSEPAAREETLGWINQVFDRLRTSNTVSIAKIQGRARGGGSELALACDMRFGEIGRAVFGQPEVGVGIIPGAGGTVRLPRLIGQARALEIILGCGDINAVVAERYGYLNRALSAAEIDMFVSSLAYRIAGFPAEALALAKESVRFSGSIEDELNHEEVAFLKSVHSEPAKRRMGAALGMGLQTAAVEKCCFTHIWAPLAGV
ncbi:enoyl-CoA hydratase/isomerase family protein [Pseudomonas paeninsulae]|uniref:enoyl-CoA hydratase/isomerase family protein n=1 Tax=Pseudomonas paeninsulae TaxID=3110772 RepID=UPI002D77E331|nr:enoyl-CoA hydratase/isomerase family protein [Pseudomonas sp. IT1137]